MSNIDRNIVDMQFKNRQFELGAKQSIDTINKLSGSIGELGKASGLEELQAKGKRFSLNGIAESTEYVAKKFSTMGIIGITVLQNLTNQAVNAGKRIVSALTIDPVKTGFNEYELKMNSVQTIMAGTGETLEVVNGYLNELNTYADRTIYSFSDMTSNIGKFTNAGVSLDLSVASMKGISNAAALAGANSNEASRAMYNFAQALSAGYVKLIDWKSIENANMATVSFKNALIETALQMGTVTKAGGGMYKTLSGETFSATKKFNEALQEQWMTSEVLTTTLAKYADETTEFGKKAYAAAQDVKTLTQLWDTLKEAAQSGWAQSWEIIVGDFDEAKSLFTILSNGIGGWLDASSTIRNNLLTGWKELGGRDDLLAGFSNIGKGIKTITDPINKAFRELFPRTTSEQLFAFTKGFKELTEKFKIGEDSSESLYKAAKAVFSIFDTGKMFITQTYEAITKLDFSWGELLEKIKPMIDGISDFIINVRDTIEETNAFGVAIENVGVGIKFVGNKIKEFGEYLKSFIEPIIGGLSMAGLAVYDFFKKIAEGMSYENVEKNLSLMNKVFGSGILGSIAFMFAKGAKGMGNFTDVLDDLGDALASFKIKAYSKALINTAIAVGILAAAVLVLSSIDADKMKVGIAGMSAIMVELGLTLAVLNKITDDISPVKMVGMGVALIGISISVGLLADALKKLGKLNSKELSKGVLATGSLLVQLGIFARLAKNSGLNVTTAAGVVLIATAIRIIVKAVKQFGDMNSEQLTKGMLAIGSILLMFAGFIGIISKTGGPKKMIAMGIGIMFISKSIQMLVAPIKDFSEMTKKELLKGFMALASIFAGLTAMLVILGSNKFGGPKRMVALGVGISAIATGIFILQKAIKGFGAMTQKELVKGFLAFGIALGVITGALVVLGAPGMAGGITLAATSIFIVSSSIVILAGALTLLGSLSWKMIIRSLTALGGALVILGVGAAVLGPLVPAMMGIAGVFAIVGVAAGLLGVGVLSLATGLTMMAAMSSVAVASLTVVMKSLIMLIPHILGSIGEGIVEILSVIIQGLTRLGTEFLQALIELTPLLLEAIIGFIVQLSVRVMEALPILAQVGLLMVTEIFQAIADNMFQIVQAGVDIILNFIRGINSRMTDIVDVAFETVIAFINALAHAIDNRGPELMEAGKNLLFAIGRGIFAMGKWVFDRGVDILTWVIDGVTSWFSNIWETGKAAVDEFIEGIKSMASDIWTIGTGIVKDFVDGILGGIGQFAGDLWDGAKEIGSNLWEGTKDFLGINSPSKKGMEIGKWYNKGIAKGLTDNMKVISKSAKNVGQTAIDGVKNAMDRVKDIVNDDMDMSPTIRPIIDMSEVEKGLSRLDKDFNYGKKSHSIANRVFKQQDPDRFKPEDNKSKGNSEIKFEQNIYSPKPVSRIEIYRETKNLINTLKELKPE